mmetsp:Transcript_95405/g.309149  ORF Transcript_95405/g.309149 Transcript_95405/m.309149 type:complete len:207 (-) Transcript_95405:1123-1743(-)
MLFANGWEICACADFGRSHTSRPGLAISVSWLFDGNTRHRTTTPCEAACRNLLQSPLPTSTLGPMQNADDAEEISEPAEEEEVIEAPDRPRTGRLQPSAATVEPEETLRVKRAPQKSRSSSAACSEAASPCPLPLRSGSSGGSDGGDGNWSTGGPKRGGAPLVASTSRNPSSSSSPTPARQQCQSGARGKWGVSAAGAERRKAWRS